MANESVIVNVFCANLRRTRKLRGITQVGMAKTLGITQASYSSLERGLYSPSLTQVSKVAEALQTPIVQLLTPQGEKAVAAAS